MNPLELRKVVLVGLVFDAPDGAPLLDAQGYPVKPVEHPTRITCALWVPQRPPFQRGPRESCVLEIRDFELDALAAGAIKEEVAEVRCDRMPHDYELAGLFLPIWEERTLLALGYLPNKPPQDDDPKPTVMFEAV